MMSTSQLSDKEIRRYHAGLTGEDRKIANRLRREITASLKSAERKVWHGSPVWFLDGNPIVGYSRRKNGVQLMFWSGMSFKESALSPIGNVKKFKAAGKIYVQSQDVKLAEIKRWLRKSKTIQWDYKNVIKRRGRLVRIR